MDAVLLVSFGGPESNDDVMPFLRRVTAGRNVPEERLKAVAEHYYDRGGVSPINAQNRELLAALTEALVPDGLPVFWGNRNSEPWLPEAFSAMADGGGDTCDRRIHQCLLVVLGVPAVPGESRRRGPGRSRSRGRQDSGLFQFARFRAGEPRQSRRRALGGAAGHTCGLHDSLDTRGDGRGFRPGRRPVRRAAPGTRG